MHQSQNFALQIGLELMMDRDPSPKNCSCFTKAPLVWCRSWGHTGTLYTGPDRASYATDYSWRMGCERL